MCFWDQTILALIVDKQNDFAHVLISIVTRYDVYFIQYDPNCLWKKKSKCFDHSNTIVLRCWLVEHMGDKRSLIFHFTQQCVMFSCHQAK